MRNLDDVTVELPAWMRWVLTAFAAVFGVLAWWLVGLDGLGADVGAVVLATFGLLLLLAAIRGRTWKWMWFVPGAPGGPGS